MIGRRPPGREHRDEIDAMIHAVRRRWRLRVAFGGVAALVVAALVALIIGAYMMEMLRFSPMSVVIARILVLAVAIGAGIRYLALPVLRQLPDERVALYVEEREPSLGASLVSALAVRGAAGADASPAMTRQLVLQATERARSVEFGRRVERPALERGAAAAVTAAAVAVGLALLGPAFLRAGARAVFWPFGGEAAVAAPVATIGVVPGNVSVPRGGDLAIRATLNGFGADEAAVLVRRGASAEWERVAMTPAATPGQYATRLLNVDSAAEYVVEAENVRSPAYKISVVDRPYARSVALEYRFPSYTGLAAQTVDDGGDIAGPRGTRVLVRVKPSAPARAGRLLLEGAAPVALALGDSGVLTGELRVEKNGFYRVELEGADGASGVASVDYTIDMLPDRPPTVTVAEPGRDVRVTRLEEVFASVDADDDYGVARVELVYTVNGGLEQTVALHNAGSRRTPEVSAGHTFFLEEMPLKPGDVVSYYARARDNDAVTGAHMAETDIYFLNVRPFGQTYRQAEQGGGGGGGEGGGESANALSERQRQIVAATHKLVRNREAVSERQRREDLATLALAQARIREQVDELAQRVQQRAGPLAGDSSLRQIAEALPRATAEMRTAEELLGRRQPDGALPPEQRALQQLQRAEAAFREVQVSLGGDQSGGGGGGGGGNPEDLADLFGLDPDRLRNQYEAVQRGEPERRAASAEVDRTLERLRELAARQQRESERMRRESEALRQQGASGGGNASGGGASSGESQRQLAQETEQLARQLERLARETPSPELQQSARQLQAAADEMRRSASASSEGAAASAQAARAKLEAARRLLDNGRSAQSERSMQEARRQASALAEEQQRVGADAERLARGEGRGGDAERRVMERKEAMEAGVGALEQELDRLAREMRRGQPDAARQLQGAADAIREGQLRERLRFSRDVARRGSPEYARNLEEQIGATIDDVKDRVDSAATAVRAPTARPGTQAVERARALARGMESLGERMQQQREAARGQQPGEAAGAGQSNPNQRALGAGQPGGEGKSGQPGSGQQGSGQGQNGQGQSGKGNGGQGAGGQAPTGAPPGAGQPGGSARGMVAGGSTASGRISINDARQFAREMSERRGDAEQLRSALAREGIPTAELQALIARMRALESQRAYNDPDEAARLQAAVVEGLKAFEFALRRRVEGEGGEQLRLGGSDEVPAGFRALVEEYYRSLARGSK